MTLAGLPETSAADLWKLAMMVIHQRIRDETLMEVQAMLPPHVRISWDSQAIRCEWDHAS